MLNTLFNLERWNCYNCGFVLNVKTIGVWGLLAIYYTGISHLNLSYFLFRLFAYCITKWSQSILIISNYDIIYIYIYINRGYIMGGFVYDFYPWVRMWYLPQVSTVNEWPISYPNEWIKIIYKYTHCYNLFITWPIFGKKWFW